MKQTALLPPKDNSKYLSFNTSIGPTQKELPNNTENQDLGRKRRVKQIKKKKKKNYAFRMR